MQSAANLATWCPLDARSNVPIPSTDTTVAVGSNLHNACNAWATHSLPALVDNACWNGAVTTSLNTNLRTTSPEMPLIPPLGFVSAVNLSGLRWSVVILDGPAAAPLLPERKFFENDPGWLKLEQLQMSSQGRRGRREGSLSAYRWECPWGDLHRFQCLQKIRPTGPSSELVLPVFRGHRLVSSGGGASRWKVPLHHAQWLHLPWENKENRLVRFSRPINSPSGLSREKHPGQKQRQYPPSDAKSAIPIALRHGPFTFARVSKIVVRFSASNRRNPSRILAELSRASGPASHNVASKHVWRTVIGAYRWWKLEYRDLLSYVMFLLDMWPVLCCFFLVNWCCQAS